MLHSVYVIDFWYKNFIDFRILVSKRIRFKIMLFACKCFHSSAPAYLKDRLTVTTHLDSRLRKLHDNNTYQISRSGCLWLQCPPPLEVCQSESPTKFKTELLQSSLICICFFFIVKRLDLVFLRICAFY